MVTSSGPGLVQTFSKGYQLAKRFYYLAVLPLFLDLASLTGMYLSTEHLYSFGIGVKFSLPIYFPSLTNVYSFPSPTGTSINVPYFGNGLLAPAFVLIFTAVVGYLSAGYLGKTTPPSLGPTPHSWHWPTSTSSGFSPTGWCGCS